MKKYPYYEKNKYIVRMLIVMFAILLGFSLFFIYNKEKLQNTEIKKATITIEYPPFSEHGLSNSEINRLISALQELNFEAESMKMAETPVGDGHTLVLETTSGNHKIVFLKPYILIENSWYKLDSETKLFNVVDDMIKKHF